MPNVTRKLAGMDDRYPVGTSVSLDKRSQQSTPAHPPQGTAVATAVVAADGSLTFTNVPDDGAGYVAYAQVSGRNVSVRTGKGAISWATRH